MTETMTYAPGTPMWVDLASPDLEASKAFYSSLFGWEAWVTRIFALRRRARIY